MIPNEIFIIGGGSSISNGISLGLKDRIENKFIIGCNYSFFHFNNTFTCFVDRDFYKTRDISKHPNIYNDLKKLLLIIGINHNGVEEFKLPNTILVKSSPRFSNNSNKCFYTKNFMTGVFALSLASFLIDYSGNIFLLGFDWTREGKTHYYEDIKHKGINYTCSYKSHNPNLYFRPFNQFKDLKIYNVSIDSNINVFEKIDYNRMFELLDENKVDNYYLRRDIRKKLGYF